MTERDSTAKAADALIERARSVMRDFEASGTARGLAIDDLIAMNNHLSDENEALYADSVGVRQEADELRRQMSVVVAEAGDLATHHGRLVAVLTELLDGMRVRMRSLVDEDRRIEAAREVAYSRARFGIGRPEEDQAALAAPLAPLGGAPSPAADHASVERAAAGEEEDVQTVRELERVVSNFGRMGRLNGQRR